MDNYKKIIDSLIDKMREEYASDNREVTKVLNYEFLKGKLYGLYETVRELNGLDAFTELYSYREGERMEINILFNREIINPLYRVVESHI